MLQIHELYVANTYIRIQKVRFRIQHARRGFFRPQNSDFLFFEHKHQLLCCFNTQNSLFSQKIDSPGPPRALPGPRSDSRAAWRRFGVGLRRQSAQNQRKGHQKSRSRNSPPDPADLPETVSSTAPRTLPSTRAGGQDDVSSNELR